MGKFPEKIKNPFFYIIYEKSTTKNSENEGGEGSKAVWTFSRYSSILVLGLLSEMEVVAPHKSLDP